MTTTEPNPFAKDYTTEPCDFCNRKTIEILSMSSTATTLGNNETFAICNFCESSDDHYVSGNVAFVKRHAI
jgi:hypothetical protein